MPNWTPLESNPEVLDEYAAKLGAPEVGTEYRFFDVFGLDEDLLAFIPQPVLAILLVFPITSETEKLREEDAMKIAASPPPPTKLFYMKQTIGNACGAIGLLHCLANASSTAAPGPILTLTEDGFVKKFMEATKEMNSEERGKFLENPAEAELSIDSIHEEQAKQGATAAPDADDDTDLHFAAFVPISGHLWELDGRKIGPVDHGETTSESLLRDIAAVVRKSFMDRSEGSLNFSLIALAAAPEEEEQEEEEKKGQ